MRMTGLKVSSREIWKDIEGFEGYYQVSNLGRVYSKRNGRTLNPWRGNRYAQVALQVNRVPADKLVHRLVAKAFISNPEGKPFVNHIDGVKTNNNAGNLEWCTQRENTIHSYKLGLQVAVVGSKNGQSKLTEDQVIRAREMSKRGCSSEFLSDEFGVCPATMHSLLKRKTWKHI